MKEIFKLNYIQDKQSFFLILRDKNQEVFFEYKFDNTTIKVNKRTINIENIEESSQYVILIEKNNIFFSFMGTIPTNQSSASYKEIMYEIRKCVFDNEKKYKA